MTEMAEELTPVSLPSSRPKSAWKLVLKITLVAAMLWFLGSKGLLSWEKTRQAVADKHFALAVGLQFIGLGLGIVRWQWLLRAQDIHLPLVRTGQLGLIGNFFNIALPGAVSGDLVKAFYIGKEVEGKRARAFGAILFDRVVGLSGLVMVSAGALALGRGSFHGTGLVRGVRWFMIFAALGVVSFYTYLFTMKEKHDPLLTLMKRIEGRFPKAGSFTRIYEGIRHYHNHPLPVAGVLVLSILIHLLVGTACYLFALALGEHTMPLISLFVVVPLGLLVTAVPVAPAGVGTGHAAFFFLFTLAGSKAGPDVFSLYALSMAIGAAMGGLVYLRFKARPPR